MPGSYPDSLWLANYDPAVPYRLKSDPEPLCGLLDAAATANPEAIAIIFNEYRLSYGDLKKQAEIMAANLRKHGVKPGDRVAIMLPNLPQTVVSFWGVLKAGAVVVMTNPLYRDKELTHNIVDAGARHIITNDVCWPKLEMLGNRLGLEKYFITSTRDLQSRTRAFLGKVGLMRETSSRVPYDKESVIPYRNLFKGSVRLSGAPLDPRDTLAALQYTGGTTGLAKGVMLSHANMTTNVRQLLAVLHPVKDKPNAVAGLLPIFHVYGLMMGILLPAALACPAVLMQRYEPGELLRQLHEHKVSIFPGAPSVYLSLMQYKDLSRYEFPDLKYCISGSAPIPGKALEQFQEITGSKVIEGYGLTETSPITHLTQCVGKHKFGSIGLPLPDTEARIVDLDDGNRTMPPNSPGELVIKGPQVMKGYYHKPSETAVALRDGWLYTGDIGYMDEDGFFYIIDRKKDMIIVGGFNVYPREVDEVLLDHPEIAEAVSAAVIHPTRGEILKAYVVRKQGSHLDERDVIAHCRRHLANYKVPRLVEFREELPRAATGKILRRVLRDEEVARLEKIPAMGSDA